MTLDEWYIAHFQEGSPSLVGIPHVHRNHTVMYIGLDHFSIS